MPRATRIHNPNKSISRNPLQRIRCLQYLHYALQQVLNPNINCKFNPSIIESLLKKNLSDVEIQDVQKLKRMIDEGEKQKPDYQERGQYINYQLLNKQKWHLDETKMIDQIGQKYLMKSIKQKEQNLAEERRHKKYQNLNICKYLNSINEDLLNKTQNIQFQQKQSVLSQEKQSSQENILSQKNKNLKQILQASKTIEIQRNIFHNQQAISIEKVNKQMNNSLQKQHIQQSEIKQQKKEKQSCPNSLQQQSIAQPSLKSKKSKSSSKLIVEKGQNETQIKVKRKYNRKPKVSDHVQNQVKGESLIKQIPSIQATYKQKPLVSQVKSIDIIVQNPALSVEKQQVILSSNNQTNSVELKQNTNQKKTLKKKKSKKQQSLKNIQKLNNSISQKSQKQEVQKLAGSGSIQNNEIKAKEIVSQKSEQKKRKRKQKQSSNKKQQKIIKKIQNLIINNPTQLKQIFRNAVEQQKQSRSNVPIQENINKQKNSNMIDESQQSFKETVKQNKQKSIQIQEKQIQMKGQSTLKIQELNINDKLKQNKGSFQDKMCQQKIIPQNQQNKNNPFLQLKKEKDQIQRQKQKGRRPKKETEMNKKSSSQEYNPQGVYEKKNKNYLKQQKRQQKQKRKYTRRNLQTNESKEDDSKQKLESNQNKRNELKRIPEIELIKIHKLDKPVLQKQQNKGQNELQQSLKKINQSEKNSTGQNPLLKSIKANSKQLPSMSASIQFIKISTMPLNKQVSKHHKIDLIDVNNTLDTSNKNSISNQQNQTLQFINIKSQSLAKKQQDFNSQIFSRPNLYQCFDCSDKQQQQKLQFKYISEEKPKKIKKTKTLQEIQQKNVQYIGQTLNKHQKNEIELQKSKEISDQNKKLVKQIFTMGYQNSQLMKKKQKEYKCPLQPQKIFKIVINYVGKEDVKLQESDEEDQKQKQQSRQNKKKKDEQSLFLDCDVKFDSD